MDFSTTIDRLRPSPSAAPRRPRALHDPGREVRAGAALAAVLVLGVGGWAVVSHLDAAVVGQGVIRLADTRQVVQAPAAGIVSAVHVANGATLRAGQPVIDFTTSDALAQERSLAARALGLQAEIARLEADLRGESRVGAPAGFAALQGDDRTQAQAALAAQQAQLDAERTLQRSEAAVMADRSRQIAHQIDGVGERLASLRQQEALSRDELAGYQRLYEKGLSTRTRLLALQRSVADLGGSAGSSRADIARLRTQVGETRLQLQQMRNERMATAADRLRLARTELDTVLPGWQAARAELQRMTVHAPIAGTVSATHLPVPGSVVAAGASLLEIVPDARTMAVEMRVPINEAADLRPGQAARVRMVGPGMQMLPPLDASVTRVSADSVQDERSGASYYVVTVRVSPAAAQAAVRSGQFAGGVRAGMPVEVMIPTQSRTALDFLLGPLLSRSGGIFSQR